MGKASLMLRFLGEHESALVLAEVHKGAYNNQIGGKTLTHKLLRVRYYWHTLMKDNIAFIKGCDKCERHVDLPHASVELSSR